MYRDNKGEIIELTDEDIERFNSKFTNTGEDNCWIWEAGFSSNNFPNFYFDGVAVKGHIFSYLIHTGDIEPSMCIVQSCGDKSCVNPNHLDKVTRSEAVMRANKVIGENNHKSVLTEEKVKQIRALEGEMSEREIAKKFGVGPSTINSVIRRKSWKHV